MHQIQNTIINKYITGIPIKIMEKFKCYTSKQGVSVLRNINLQGNPSDFHIWGEQYLLHL